MPKTSKIFKGGLFLVTLAFFFRLSPDVRAAGSRADVLWYLGPGHQSTTGSERGGLDELGCEIVSSCSGIKYEITTSSQFVKDGKLQYPDGSPRYGLIMFGGGMSTAYYYGTPYGSFTGISTGPGLGDTGRTKTINYINKGGNYVGMCAGAFFASEQYCDGNGENCGNFGKYLGIWPGYSVDYHSGRLDSDHTLLTTHPINANFGSKIYNVYFNGGADLATGVADTSYVAAFSESYYDYAWRKSEFDGKKSIIVYDKGLVSQKGRIVVSGSHPEVRNRDYFKRMITYALEKRPEVVPKALSDNSPVVADIAAGASVPSGHYFKIGDKQYHYYSFEVTSSTNLAITLTGNSVDNDLYVRKGDLPTVSNNNYKSTNSGTSNETVAINSASSGIWFIGVYGYAAVWDGSTYTVMAKTSGTTLPTPSATPTFGPTQSPTPLPTKSPTPHPTATASPHPTPTSTSTSLATPTPTATPGGGKPGDVNGDGVVNMVDIGIIIDVYGIVPVVNTHADLNHDGQVNMVDIGIVVDNYGA